MDELDTTNYFSLLLIVWIFGVEDTLCVKGVMGTLPWGSTGSVVTVGVTVAKVFSGEADRAERWRGVTAGCMCVSLVFGSLCAVWYVRYFGSAAWGFAVTGPYLAVLLLLHDFWLTRKAEAKDRKSSVAARTFAALDHAVVHGGATGPGSTRPPQARGERGNGNEVQDPSEGREEEPIKSSSSMSSDFLHEDIDEDLPVNSESMLLNQGSLEDPWLGVQRPVRTAHLFEPLLAEM